MRRNSKGVKEKILWTEFVSKPEVYVTSEEQIRFLANANNDMQVEV